MEEKHYYSRRKKKTSDKDIIDLSILKSLFEAIYNDFYSKAFFTDNIGSYLYGKHQEGSLGDDHDIERLLFTKLRKRNLWPIYHKIYSYDEVDLFDIIEFCYDYISNPKPNDPEGYDINSAKKEFRDAINEHLRDYEEGFEINESGEIVPLTWHGIKNIYYSDIPSDDQENIVKPITEAVKKFRDRHSSGEDRKDAVRDLADVLEYLQKSYNLKVLLLSKQDESDLFNIINNFNIRHHNKVQKKDYNKVIWYNWMFYCFLATIHAILRCINDNKKQPQGEKDESRSKY